MLSCTRDMINVVSDAEYVCLPDIMHAHYRH